MKKIMLYARDPGGANTIIPLVDPLLVRGYQIMVYGKDSAIDRYRQMGISAEDVNNYLSEITIEGWRSFLDKEKPDFIITGTSGDDFSERYLWEAARTYHIRSFAILDQWINYGIRFSAYRLDERLKYQENKQHLYLPERILVMDEEARRQTQNEGIDAAKIMISGQPYFDYLMQQKGCTDPEVVASLRKQVGCGQDDFFITFVSEALSTDYPESVYGGPYWGFDERSTCRRLLEVINELASESNKRITLLIKQHPREGLNSYASIVDEFNKGNIHVIARKDIDIWPLLLASDLVCGMFSMVLLEAVMLGRPVLSIQIGLKQENPLVLHRRGILKSIVDEDKLQSVLRGVILEARNPEAQWDIQPGAIDNVIKHMEELL